MATDRIRECFAFRTEKILPGDILLCTGKGAISVAIKWVAWGNFSHAAICTAVRYSLRLIFRAYRTSPFSAFGAGTGGAGGDAQRGLPAVSLGGRSLCGQRRPSRHHSQDQTGSAALRDLAGGISRYAAKRLNPMVVRSLSDATLAAIGKEVKRLHCQSGLRASHLRRKIRQSKTAGSFSPFCSPWHPIVR
jgi:hypothetical protein